MAKSLLHTADLHIHSRYSIFKRIVNLIIVIVMVLLFVNLWFVDNDNAQNWQQKQRTQLGNSLGLISSEIIAQPLIDNDTTRIEQLLTIVMNDPHVEAVAVYDQYGQQVAQQGTLNTIVEKYLDDQHDTPLVFVKDIRVEKQIYGYVRLLLNEQSVMALHNEYQSQLRQQTQVLGMLAALAALLITRVFYKVRYRRYVHPNDVEKRNQ
ncbi:AhpA/YtjB family protein [Paraglaciecola chathamensis]|uniref:AhpA/YtjB family protein n=1 Tax=Paraglaciecola chathamensis TaxID=368405 RepID=UPI0026F4A083|nr:AhpA/YtjB family protein [Paraglaciecola chathamensis]MDO6560455.1 AhpA/YtjB family protein [Paraglaciecola chathamensis]